MRQRNGLNQKIVSMMATTVALAGWAHFPPSAVAFQTTTRTATAGRPSPLDNGSGNSAGEYRGDVETLARRVAANPDDVFAVAQLIEAYIRADRLDAAETVVSTAAPRFSGVPQFESAVARIDEHRLRWREAADRLRRIGDARTDDDSLRLVRALRTLGRTDEADEELRWLIQRSPRNEHAWCAWVEGALERDRPAQALEHVQEARKAVGSAPCLYYLAARATFALKGAFGETQIRALPDARPGQFINGWLVLEPAGPMGRALCAPPDSAIALVRHALDEGIEDAACHLLHARIWHAAGRPESARAVIRSRPGDFWRMLDDRGLEHLIAICMDVGDVEAALTWSRTRAERSPAKRIEILATAYLAAADVYNQRGNAEIHRNYLRRALELRPDDPSVLLRLADADWECGDRGRAAESYQILLERRAMPAAETRILERLAEWQSAQTEKR